MNLTEKIKQILSDKALSPSIFADEIGIQRSSMSHLLAGRNKPSLEMVQKIIRRYPDLGLDWIMEENELPELSPDQPQAPAKQPAPATEHKAGKDLQKSKVKEVEQPKTVDRIIIFYTDGTFQQFREGL